ncbi:four-helix bundle copper-binding protein [Spirosoma sp. KUDC1026]|uniref:four-helix bundle copper-binding protein n=1 Tax=Spirosoma sp. KUDC1026 TaxID=2745947 RepID=UPI00159BC1B1|nr:four-helix bundle copper-binding protein [Spirosoma sp. KUDC1026]QKZ14656.1 four-helix bundle copper-binding protein [Spirosoma sp. KUDC1026]
MEKDIYRSLVRCAVRCEAVAAECSVSDRDENQYQKILLHLDCASMCRQVAMLYLRGTDKVQHLAKDCIHVCESCLQQLSPQQTGKEMAEKACLEAIQSCLSILNVSSLSEQATNKVPAAVFYGVTMNEPVRY